MATTLIFVIFVGGHWFHRIFHTPLLLLKLKSSIKGEGYNFKVHKMGIEYITKWLVNPGLNNKHLFIFRADLTISAAWHYPPFSQNLQLQTLLVHQTSPTDIIVVRKMTILRLIWISMSCRWGEAFGVNSQMAVKLRFVLTSSESNYFYTN